jgi:hypothetical protein
MKKSAILGMVLATTMSFSAFAAGPKTLLERVAEQRAKIEESLYGKDKTGKVNSLASLPEADRRTKQDALIDKLTGDKATELRDYLRQGDKATELARTETLSQLLAAKTYAESIKDNAEAKEILDASNAMVKLLANSTRAKDRNDEATITLSEQSANILKWSSAQRKNVTKIVELQDKYMTEGMESRAALDKAYSEVKGVSLEVAKKAVDKIKELCKV